MKNEVLKRFLKNKLAVIGLVILTIFVLAAVFAPFITSFDRDSIDLMNIESAPNSLHILGTDELGRDVLQDFFMEAGFLLEWHYALL